MSIQAQTTPVENANTFGSELEKELFGRIDILKKQALDAKQKHEALFLHMKKIEGALDILNEWYIQEKAKNSAATQNVEASPVTSTTQLQPSTPTTQQQQQPKSTFSHAKNRTAQFGNPRIEEIDEQ